MESLKEWATVVKALENGDQIVLLRKGGILETASGFQLESKKFLLFPTWEHQELHHIKPQFHKYLYEAKNNLPEKGFNLISSYAEVLSDVDIFSDEIIKQLSPFHVWSDSYIAERRNWKPEKPIKALFLRVCKIPERTVCMKSEYQGCKSWININEEISNGVPVLNQEILQSRLEEFKEIAQ